MNRYWLLRSLKDPIVATIVGVDYIPNCKMLSLVVVFTLVSQHVLVRGKDETAVGRSGRIYA